MRLRSAGNDRGTSTTARPIADCASATSPPISAITWSGARSCQSSKRTDPSQVECVCYAGGTIDAVAQRFQARADHWRNMERWTDTQLAAQIHADRIDILVDLGLHTAHNRLVAFARKPAPIQVSWLGLSRTARGRDNRLLAHRSFSSSHRKWMSRSWASRPFRLPNAWSCYAAPEGSPGVGALPADDSGHITFGSFNNFAKINGHALEIWARILHAVPDSRLVLVAKMGSHQARAGAALEKCGVAAERCTVLDHQPVSLDRGAGDYLGRYAQVDIALDPFPYNGMTTTCDALWMGVPVVAYRSSTGVSRAAFSLLSNLGLSELAGSTEDDYVQIAIGLARNPSRLRELRATLRGRMEASPLLDMARFARNLEAAYRAMWREWCLRPGDA